MATLAEIKAAINEKDYVSVDEIVILIDNARGAEAVKTWCRTGRFKGFIQPGGANGGYIIRRQQFMDWFNAGGMNAPLTELTAEEKKSEEKQAS